MAGAQSSPAYLIQRSITATISKKPFLVLSTIALQRPRKLTKRKNYLRPKILKTLTKPYTSNPVPEILLPQNDPISPFDDTQLEKSNLFQFDQLAVDEMVKESENQELRLSEVSEPAGVLRDIEGTFSKSSLMNFGMWFVGALVFQTICAVWFLGSAEFSGENGELDSKKSKSKMRVLLNGNEKLSIENGGIVYVDEAEMEKKIEEIRVMAREARESERLKSKTNEIDEDEVDDSDNEIDDSDANNGIKKEVDERLMKVTKRMEKVSNKLPTSVVTYPRMDDEKDGRDVGGNLNEKELNAALSFKKKYKFKDLANRLVGQIDKPKGFMASDDQSVGRHGEKTLEVKTEVLRNGSVGDSVVDVAGEDQVDLPNLDSLSGAFTNFGESTERNENTEEAGSETPAGLKKPLGNKERRKKGKRMSAKKIELGKVDPLKAVKKNSSVKRGRMKKGIELSEKSESGRDTSQDRNSGSSLFEAVDSKESSILEHTTATNIGKVSGEILDSKESCSTGNTMIPNKHKQSIINGSLKKTDAKEDKQLLKANGDMKSRNETDFWWLRLPYVLVIFMRRGHDGEGSEGLFTLKCSSQLNGDSSHTVAFEDRGDANNFCYLLESFFEDLEDFSAEIAPLPIKELSEAVMSHTMKVIVVKKGQLQLYAGQPLADAEMALRSLVGEK